MTTQKDFALGESAIKARMDPLIGAKETARTPVSRWIPMADWSEVFPGNRGVNREGRYDLYDAPVGIKLRVEECDKSPILIRPEQPWEGAGQIVPLAFWSADGRYHMLYGVWDRRAKIDRSAKAFGGVRTCTCYAVSDDAYHWTKPQLNRVEYEGSAKNNIIPHTLMGVPFLDPKAPPAQRFRAMGQEGANFDPETGQELTPQEAGRRYKAMDLMGPEYKGPGVVGRHWIAGWTSPDGIEWTRIDKHLAEMPSDGGTAAQYDPETETYFAYLRVGGFGRRAIGLARTKEFWHWPFPELVFAPDPQDDPEISFYGVNYFRYPGASSLHGMIVQIYHQRTDHMDNQLAFSRDGIHWYRPDRRPIIPVGGPGSGEEGMTRCAQTGIAILPDGCWGMLYEGSSMLHNASGYMEVPPGQIRWARWQPHRLCGIESEHEGRLTIPTVKRGAKELRLNYRCKLGGWICVELIHAIPSRIHPDVPGLPGFTFEECDRLTGDSSEGIVTWKGRSDTAGAGESFAIRVRMFQAALFAYAV